MALLLTVAPELGPRVSFEQTDRVNTTLITAPEATAGLTPKNTDTAVVHSGINFSGGSAP